MAARRCGSFLSRADEIDRSRLPGVRPPGRGGRALVPRSGGCIERALRGAFWRNQGAPAGAGAGDAGESQSPLSPHDRRGARSQCPEQDQAHAGAGRAAQAAALHASLGGRPAQVRTEQRSVNGSYGGGLVSFSAAFFSFCCSFLIHRSICSLVSAASSFTVPFSCEISKLPMMPVSSGASLRNRSLAPMAISATALAPSK